MGLPLIWCQNVEATFIGERGIRNITDSKRVVPFSNDAPPILMHCNIVLETILLRPRLRNGWTKAMLFDLSYTRFTRSRPHIHVFPFWNLTLPPRFLLFVFSLSSSKNINYSHSWSLDKHGVYFVFFLFIYFLFSPFFFMFFFCASQCACEFVQLGWEYLE